MAAKEQLIAMEMIWDLMNGRTGHLGRTDFVPQKEAFDAWQEPEQYFERVTPESQGIPSGMLSSMIRELSESRLTDIHHLLVLRNGKMVCECSFSPYRRGIWHITHSMCKSITGMAVGLLVSEGGLSLDENIYDIFAKKTGLFQRILRQNVTVEHLLTMTSGVQFNEMGVVSGNDWVESFLSAPIKGTPGEEFEYNSMNSYMLSAIITEKTGMSMMEYLRPRLFEPLGIHRVFWESCPKGITKGGWGLFLCPEDAAKLGWMYLQNGRFEEKQIIPEEWVAQSTVKHATPPESMGKYGYGYQVWMEERPGSFAFNGMLGQDVLGYPDTGIVIVTNAGSNELFQSCELLDIIRRYFGAGFTPERTRKEDPAAFRSLQEVCGRMSGIRRQTAPILRGGWKNHAVSRRTMALADTLCPQLLYRLNGQSYEIEDARVGILPLVMQVFHNNFSEGISEISFACEKNRFYLLLTEGKVTYRIEVGFQSPALTQITVNGEPYLVAVTGTFTHDETAAPVLALNIAYLEEAARRTLTIRFQPDALLLHWNETPGQSLIIEGLESLLTTMAGSYFLTTLREKASEVIHLLMNRTIEPVIRAHRRTEPPEE